MKRNEHNTPLTDPTNVQMVPLKTPLTELQNILMAQVGAGTKSYMVTVPDDYTAGDIENVLLDMIRPSQLTEPGVTVVEL